MKCSTLNEIYFCAVYTYVCATQVVSSTYQRAGVLVSNNNSSARIRTRTDDEPWTVNFTGMVNVCVLVRVPLFHNK